MANGTKVRRNVWKLAEWDDVLLWYAKAVREMLQRPIADPTSWRYQAAIHEYLRPADPLANPSDVLPSTAQMRRFWSQCQHGTWFFLPWHRMYLACFEQIVAGVITKLSGPPAWALPYWNYSDGSNGDARRLPPAFREEKLPDGSPNPLFVDDRNPDANDGALLGDGNDVDLADCLGESRFIGQPGGNPGFGGARTAFSHSGGGIGKLEWIPHATMHMAVNGWMGSFNTAALDPIFWLHHANIDRLWTVWRRRKAGHLDPTEAGWLTNLSFEFHDATGQEVSFTSSQVVDTTVPLLSYRYEDEGDPLGAGLEVIVERTRQMDQLPEMVGATDKPVVLKGRAETVELAVSQPTGPALAALESGGPPPPMYLNLENVTGAGRATSYGVYLNLPPGSDPKNHEDLLAGVVPMFGVKEASREDQGHPGSGLHYALEISPVVRRLEAKNAWNPGEIRITFVPRHLRGDGLEAAGDPIQVGRVSLYLG